MPEPIAETSTNLIYSKELEKDIPIPNDPLALITEIQAAAFINVTRRCMQAWRLSGNGPKFVRLSQRCVRYRQAELSSYADDRLQQSTSQEAISCGM